MLLAPHTPAAAEMPMQSTSVAARSSFQLGQHVTWQGTVVVQSDQREDSFAIGPDGCVWNFVRLAGADPILLPTGLKASSFAVGCDSHGRLVVFASTGLRLQACMQQPEARASMQAHWNPQACSQWSKAVTLSLPDVPHASSIVRVSCEGVGEHLHVGALMHCQRPQLADHFELAVSHWPKDGQKLKHFRHASRAWVNAWQELLLDLRQLADQASQGRSGAAAY